MRLDMSDYYINQYGIAVAAPVSIVAVIWLAWKWKDLRANANATSTFKIGPIWLVCLGVITPIMLAAILVFNVRDLLGADPNDPDDPFGGYNANQAFGWSLALGAIVFGVVMALILRRKDVPELVDEADEAGEKEEIR